MGSVCTHPQTRSTKILRGSKRSTHSQCMSMTSFSDVNIVVNTARRPSANSAEQAPTEGAGAIQPSTVTSSEPGVTVGSTAVVASPRQSNPASDSALQDEGGGQGSRSAPSHPDSQIAHAPDDAVGDMGVTSRSGRGSRGGVKTLGNRVNSRISVDSSHWSQSNSTSQGLSSGRTEGQRGSEGRHHTSVATESLVGLPEHVTSLLTGRDQGSILRTSCTSMRMIRLYVTSSYPDLVLEKAWLRQSVLPELRHMAAERGYWLDVRDPYWSLPQDHVAASYVISHQRELCQRHRDVIESCEATSLVLVMLGEKLGSALPSQMTSETLEDVIARIDDVNDQALLRSHYVKPRGATTSLHYELQPSLSVETYNSLLTVLRRAMTSSQAAEYLPSAFENDLTWLVSQQNVSPEKVLVYNRTIEGPVEESHEMTPFLCDVIDDTIDDVKRERLRDVREKLRRHIPESNWFSHSITWDELISENVVANANRTRHKSRSNDSMPELGQALHEAMSRTLEVLTSAESTLPLTVVCPALYEEMAHHVNRRVELLKMGCAPLRHVTLKRVQRYLATADDRRPLVVKGLPGSGTSTLCAHVWKRCMETSDVILAFRFLGITPDCGSVTSAMISLRHQLEHVYGDVIRQKSSTRLTLLEMLGLATKTRPLVMVIDGVCQLRSPASLDWLPNQLPPHSKLVVSVDSDLMKTLDNEAFCVIELPPLTTEDATTLLGALPALHPGCRSRDISSISAREPHPHPLQLYVTAHLQCLEDTRGMDEEKDDHMEENRLPGSLSEASERLLEYAEQKIGVEIVRRFCCWLTVSVMGLADHELSDLASCDDGLLHELYTSLPPPVPHRVPPVTWYALHPILAPLLRTHCYRGLELHMWKNEVIAQVVRNRYQEVPGSVVAAHHALADYFSGRWAEGKGKPYFCPLKGVEIVKDRLVLAQPIRFKHHPNPRRLLELPVHTLATSGAAEALRCLEDARGLMDWIETTSVAVVLQFLHDMAQRISGQDLHDVTLLHEALSLSARALHVSARALFHQLPARLAPFLKLGDKGKTSERLRSLCDACEAEQNGGLVADRPVLQCVQEDGREITPREVFAGLYPLQPSRSDSQLLAATLPDAGAVQVVNVRRRSVVRTLRGLCRPSQLAMLDNHRAVVLCGRELVVADLDAGCLQTKLKGVLPLKFPLFGVWGSNSVVVLSRNRMTVNVVDVQSGDTLVTFKVGEDRFLASLHLSREGDVMVCGEEGGPGTLLVWQLRESRLMHDLRVPQHTFLPHTATLSSTGSLLVCVCQEADGEVATLVLVWSMESGHVTRRWRSDVAVTSVGVAGRVVVALLQTGDLQVWDLVAGMPVHRISGVHAWHNRKSISEDGRLCATYFSGESRASEASTVCLWNLETGLLLGFMTFDLPPTCCALSPDGRGVVVGLPGEETLVFLSHKPRPLAKSANHEQEAEPSRSSRELGGEASDNDENIGDDDDDVVHVFGDPLREGMEFDVSLNS